MTSKDVLRSLAQSATELLPQEEMLEVGSRKKDLFIGIPKETSFQEKRVPLTPSAVGVLVSRGHKVLIESGAGAGANFQDNDYSEVGAVIAYDTKEVYKADIILKVEPLSFQELDLLQYNQTIITALQLPVQPKNFLKKMMDKKITAIAYDFIKDKEGNFPVLRAMSEIAGNTSVLIAAELLARTSGMMVGGISGVPPTEIVIIGAGTVGEFATRSAIGLGASVKVFDNSMSKLRRIQNNVDARLFTSVLEPYALSKALISADVAIGAIRSSEGRTPCYVTEQMVSNMKHGSVIVDVSIDQGGCFETSELTTHDNPTFTKYGVTHFCVPNIPSRVSRTASRALSNVFTQIIIQMGDAGGVVENIRKEDGIRSGIYMFRGLLTNKYLGETFKLPYKDLDLLIAAIR